ncbi:conserved hypothetical protein [Ricinus communis]|uniref:RNase H type-1 domain-containing protein n=1 Tax=Ricinus communis TaxID=3988 RepID=B9SNH1_RICCO|nr:conserved hypothetical protein [Ricinus communis]
MVLRDHRGVVKLARSCPINQVMPVNVAEALAIKWGLSVVNSICNREDDYSEAAAIVSDISAMIPQDSLSAFKFIFI